MPRVLKNRRAIIFQLDRKLYGALEFALQRIDARVLVFPRITERRLIEGLDDLLHFCQLQQA